MAQQQLISIRALGNLLGDEKLRILDCRFDLADVDAGRADYLAGHIPGAVFVDLNRDLAAPPGAHTGRHPLPSVEDVTRLFSHLGIDRSTEVVVYDGGNGSLAARTWWMLRWLGHDQVRLLDGGYSAWQAAGLPHESGVVEVHKRKFVANVHAGRIIGSDEIQAASSGSAPIILLDARDPARFRGEVEPIDAVAGHIPGAQNLPFTANLTEDGYWKDRAERNRIWQEALGPAPGADWVAMCGSGVTACHLVLSAVDAGFSEPRLYVGSWSEWIADSKRPIARGGA